ncbi:hypothetical protein K437DRAFT_257967 [Tilletiaria anomala UBC 951]|uniref:Sodium/calcium exchanger membrane region domain-containing protein n=1 Tax=Tilletiaria anomala (strain ATCC 24038 / CBS 436.72 / UBC 951) TaxID=1037660 RepID=A0A066VKB7_TILAU|nr:uncharacterized protein K437DRAFT_257967 [Tilletiaria anomala UBC 951]KDN42187.1 hypothetical protein K437DRAFT_257967 [Tilletiaria anomala UBC 951]
MTRGITARSQAGTGQGGVTTDGNLLFNLSAFISGVYMLERGADSFLDNLAVFAGRLRVSETLVALLTAGAEWEELVVVAAAMFERNSALAYGNIVGSCISNILGAFSLGLLFAAPGPSRHAASSLLAYGSADDQAVAPRPPSTTAGAFDGSARICAIAQFLFTVLASALLLSPTPSARARLIKGTLLLAFFAAYMGAAAWAIYRGVLAAPEGSDDSSSSESGSGSDASSTDSPTGTEFQAQTASVAPADTDCETAPLLQTRFVRSSTSDSLAGAVLRSFLRSTVACAARMLVGLLALSLAGLVLSHSAAGIASSLGLSQTAFGLTLLGVTTTLPEKMLAVLAGHRGSTSVLVSAAAGSNMFLLTLCAGVAVLGEGNGTAPVPVSRVSMAWMLLSSALLLASVLHGHPTRWQGWLLLVLYAVFLGSSLAMDLVR